MGKSNIPSGPSIAELNASGALGGGSVGQSNVGSSAATGPSHSETGGMEGGAGGGAGNNYSQHGLEGDNLLPVEGKSIAMPGSGAAVGEFFDPQGIDLFTSINAKGGALGSSVVAAAGLVANHLGTQSANGDNLAIEQLTGGDMQNLKAPTIQGDVQAKHVGLRGSGEAQH